MGHQRRRRQRQLTQYIIVIKILILSGKVRGVFSIWWWCRSRRRVCSRKSRLGVLCGPLIWVWGKESKQQLINITLKCLLFWVVAVDWRREVLRRLMPGGGSTRRLLMEGQVRSNLVKSGLFGWNVNCSWSTFFVNPLIEIQTTYSSRYCLTASLDDSLPGFNDEECLSTGLSVELCLAPTTTEIPHFPVVSSAVSFNDPRSATLITVWALLDTSDDDMNNDWCEWNETVRKPHESTAARKYYRTWGGSQADTGIEIES